MGDVSEEALLDYFSCSGGSSGRVRNADLLKIFKPFIGHADLQLRGEYSGFTVVDSAGWRSVWGGVMVTFCSERSLKTNGPRVFPPSKLPPQFNLAVSKMGGPPPEESAGLLQMGVAKTCLKNG